MQICKIDNACTDVPDDIVQTPSYSNATLTESISASLRNYRYLFVVAMLVPIFYGIYFLSYWFRFEGVLGFYEHHCIRATVGWIICVKMAWFVGFGACRGWSRLVTYYDLYLLLRASLASGLSVVLIYCLLVPSPVIPRSVLLSDWGATLLVLGGLRLLWRGWCNARWIFFQSGDQIRVFVAGVGETGQFMLRAVRLDGESVYRIVGFLSDNDESVGLQIEGIPIVGTLDQTRRLVSLYKVQKVLVVQGEFPGINLKRLIHEAEEDHFTVRVIPDYKHLIDGSMTFHTRPVTIEDLLQREPVQLDIENIEQWLDGQTVLVTGSAGSIGSEICRQLLSLSPRRIIAVDRSENGQFFLEHQLRSPGSDVLIDFHIADVLDKDAMRNILDRYKPEVIFHAAAYKHVPLMEAHPGEAVKNIVTATRQMADLAVETGVKSFVLISTDKVVNPTSVMGACKRTAELYLQSLQGRTPCRFVTVRFGNVIDSAGSVVQIFRRQIAAGGPVTVTDPEICRFFMTIPEAARLVIQAGALGEDGQIMFLEMGEPIRIAELAAEMIRLSGLRLNTDINIEYTGLRPGEKMYEELYSDNEERLPTRHPKIILVRYRRAPRTDLMQDIAELEFHARINPRKIFAKLQEIVPEYRLPADSPAIVRIGSEVEEKWLKAS
jgi:FlaA1/EpsC-like NDP-sugar epimerase